MMKKIMLSILLCLLSFQLSHTFIKENGEINDKNVIFMQIDRDMNEPPYSVINVFYTESLLNDDLVKEIENNRKMEKNKIQNYFRKNLSANKYFMDYSTKQKEQMESLIDLS
ncbi:conserved Plasmodium protein, unknown function [Plasmodium malariae]|uniref:LIMP protein n=1 Tax=Plasmodium malariae TaxID=5858 RepID=A0A1D3TCD2_PLAMA|nr:conserved Plasmodium protein, unknown function [Plasmodium malariae]SCP02525.1 conserved Plasmodium protein, unknown function [Plasmodium malariae]